MKKSHLLLITGMLFFAASGCKNVEQATAPVYPGEVQNNDYMELAILYHQRSAEIKALYYQSFNLAKLMFEEDLANKNVAKKRAIVVDIDETMLDNSPYEAECVMGGITYPVKWDEWVNKGTADALPGAVDLLNFFAGKGAEVFYVSNRTEDQREGTLKNLKEKGFPYADNQHLKLKTKTSTKEIYRQQIAENFHISLLIGDNLSDFVSGFEKQPSGIRDYKVDSLRNEFGKRFVILPNAMYGDWESALYNYNYKQTEKQKDSCRKANLKGF
ncbi:MAG TPA: 5'-nucleotidase, lipoprotein e(P4) family [Bacteroidales bacterium]|nr:5'-nucleotidase, lipoprotein e(P4) family [Bacteroidales bacterium]